MNGSPPAPDCQAAKRNPRAGRAPAFQFYPADWLSDARVAAMTLEEEGAYIRLICFCWREGKIPTDPAGIARLLKVDEAKAAQFWVTIGPCFHANGTHGRLDSERRKQRTFSRLQSDRANAGWRKRQEDQSTSGMPERCRNDALQSASASASAPSVVLPPVAEMEIQETLPLAHPRGERSRGRVKDSTGELYSEAFRTFWHLYPRKTGKGAAWRSWRKLRPNDRLIEEIHQAVENQRDSFQWRRDGGQFVPHPATWLNQRRWEDEPDPVKRAQTKEEQQWQVEKARFLKGFREELAG